MKNDHLELEVQLESKNGVQLSNREKVLSEIEPKDKLKLKKIEILNERKKVNSERHEKNGLIKGEEKTLSITDKKLINKANLNLKIK